jgi:hypothetical protein
VGSAAGCSRFSWHLPRFLKKPRQASIDEVYITQEMGGAIIEFADPTISGVHFRLGPQTARMSDAAIHEAFNSMIDAHDESPLNLRRRSSRSPLANHKSNIPQMPIYGLQGAAFCGATSKMMNMANSWSTSTIRNSIFTRSGGC